MQTPVLYLGPVSPDLAHQIPTYYLIPGTKILGGFSRQLFWSPNANGWMLETNGNVYPLQNAELLFLEQGIRNGSAHLEAPSFVDESFSFLSKPSLEDHPYCIVLNKPLVTAGAKFVANGKTTAFSFMGRRGANKIPDMAPDESYNFTLVEADGKWGLLREYDCYLRSEDFYATIRPNKPLGKVDDLWAAIANEGLALVSTG